MASRQTRLSTPPIVIYFGNNESHDIIIIILYTHYNYGALIVI